MPHTALANDPRLMRVSQILGALPETTAEVHDDYAVFRVRKRVVAYFLSDHHGDGIVSLCVKSELGENEERARRQPSLYYLPAHIGRRGWFGMRLDRGNVEWQEVENIIELSYRLVAPKTLVSKLAQ
jgi:predicted DNA-binding protein (MmcQ/YjbR family)